MKSLSGISDFTGPLISDQKAKPAQDIQGETLDSGLWTRDEYIGPRECHLRDHELQVSEDEL